MSKKRTIEELYYKYNIEAQKITNDVKQLNNKLNQKIERFDKTISAEQRELFYELLDLINVRNGFVNRNVFIYAFSLANKLNKESLK